MAKQNIYDNEVFFEGYKKLRDREFNANKLFEIPALFSLLPDLTGLTILDLGCGFGEHCKGFIERGAAKVVGIDISEKMLEVAKAENSDPKITYLNMPMEDLDKIEEKNNVDKINKKINNTIHAAGSPYMPAAFSAKMAKSEREKKDKWGYYYYPYVPRIMYDSSKGLPGTQMLKFSLKLFSVFQCRNSLCRHKIGNFGGCFFRSILSIKCI